MCHTSLTDREFVLSGADLLYWRRKREQWASIAERAPDDAIADYLHQVWNLSFRAPDLACAHDPKDEGEAG